MDIIISNNTSKPIYEQITSQIKQMIMTGELKPGESIPSMRSLAKSLHISVITVQRSYEDLQKDGFIETTVGRGSFVSSKNKEFIQEEKQREIESHLQKAIELSKENGISLAKLIDLLKIFYEEKSNMSDYSLKVENLTKKYDDFLLDKVSFYVPKGNIVGLIGENGAGKSTTINTMLDIIERDSGDIYILDSEKNKVNNEIREKIGVVFDGNNFPEDLTPQKLNNVLTRIYKNWNDKTFFKYIEKFNLPKTKKIKNFSKGMKMKLSISVALSHNAELLILDEATSGLDPIVRDDILDILLEFVQDENKSILISSHITSDLEKVADYIVFIHKGKVIFEETKDNLIYDYGIMKCKQKDFSSIDKEDIIRFRKMDYGYEILVKNKNELERKYPNMVMDNIKIEDIMLMYVKGEK